MALPRPGTESLPEADLTFLRVFLPYELCLAQRRAMVWGSVKGSNGASPFIGLYLIRLEAQEGGEFPSAKEALRVISEHVQKLLHGVIRDSDIPVQLSAREHLTVLRDIDPQHAYVMAQRFLASAGRSDLLRGAQLNTRVGYIVYPLSTQPNFPPSQWETLLELARRISLQSGAVGPACGYGLLRGSQMEAAAIPETDLVPLAFQDTDTLVRSGILQLQRIHLLPGI
jgi:hypothetical protein